MENIDEPEAPLEGYKAAFFVLYDTIEQLNQEFDLQPFLRKKPFSALVKGLKPLERSQELMDELEGDMERFDYLIRCIALVMKLFSRYGPGQAAAAWNAQVEAYRHDLEESSGGAE